MDDNPLPIGFFDHFAMMVPQNIGFQFKEPPKPPRWKRWICFFIGHKWVNPGITYTGPGFPRKCKRCKKDKWFIKPTFRMRLAKWLDKTLDKLWKPLCKVGVHRWKSHFGFQSFSFGSGESQPTIKQAVYKCSCCKKTKTVSV